MFNLLGNLQKNIAGLYEPKAPSNPSEEIDANKVVCADECEDNLKNQPDSKQDGNEAETKNEKSSNNFFTEAALNTSLIADKMFGYARVAHEKANKLSSIISEHTIIGHLEKENEHFKEILQNEKLVEACDYPWTGMPDENVARKHIFSLSLDERNFLAEPPINDNLKSSNVEGLAAKLLTEDSNLEKMRYKLVPKQISEEHFWRNYFYRVSLVKKLLLDKKKENVIAEDVHAECSQPKDVPSSDQTDNNPTTKNAEASSPLSDTEQKSSVSGKQGSNTDDDWEKELLSNLDEFELVENGGKSEVEWDQEINALLQSENGTAEEELKDEKDL